MAFQPINFLQAPKQSTGLENLFQMFGQGFQAAQLPAQAQRAAAAEKRAASSAMLADALKSMQLQQAKMNLDESKKFQDALGEYTKGSAPQDEGMGLRKSLVENITPPMRRPQEGFYQVAADSSDTNVGDAGHPKPPLAGEKSPMQVIEQGDPGLHWADKMYMENPQWRNMLEKRGLKMSRSVKSSPETGQAFETITYPSGRMESRAVEIGRSPESIERGKGMVKAESKVYDSALDGQQAASNVSQTLHYLSNMVQANPDIANATGPINGVIGKYLGNEATQEALGAVDSISANLMQQMASGFKGAFTGREQGLITNSKPNSRDNVPRFMGKLRTLQQLTDLAYKRNQLIAKNYQKGMSADDAIEAARRDTDMSPFMQEKGRKEIVPKVSQSDLSDENIMHTAQKYGLTPAQVRARLGAQNAR